jgi:hypothetical protein
MKATHLKVIYAMLHIDPWGRRELVLQRDQEVELVSAIPLPRFNRALWKNREEDLLPGILVLLTIPRSTADLRKARVVSTQAAGDLSQHADSSGSLPRRSRAGVSDQKR